jgi:hypothetical protein
MQNVVTTEELLGRLQTLEAENLKMKRWAAVFLILIGSVIFMAQAGKNRALDADSLTIRDASGKSEYRSDSKRSLTITQDVGQ